MARSSWKKRALRVVLVLALVVLGALGLYIAYLDRTVTRQFEGRRWTLPAQVYAAPLELYTGLALSREEVEEELQRLQYRKISGATGNGAQSLRPGTYRREGTRLEVMLRPARFADVARPAQQLTIRADGSRIQGLADAAGKELPITRLEPMLIGSIFPTHGEDRIVVKPEEVPPLLPAALKAVEDRKFDTHHGVDPLGILRAMWVNLRAGRVEQGASTLTQQLVRSYFLDTRQTMSRKLREAAMAMALEARFSKDDLMNAYINEIFLGQDGRRAVHGFGLASQFYFGKPLSELDLEEVALLVAVARGPSYYDPRRRPERVRKRRDLVLQILADQGILKKEEARAAAAKPLGVTKRSSGGYFPAYLDFARRTLRRDYRDQDLTESGLRVFTSLEPRAQAHAEAVLESELTRLDRARKPKKGTKKDAPVPKLEGSIVITAPDSGDVIAIVGGRQAGYDGFNRALDARRGIGSLVKPFVYLHALESGRYNAASVVMDNPMEIKVARGKSWKPQNYTRQSYGPVPLVRALAESLNLATVTLGMELGVPQVGQTLERFGLEREPPNNPSVLLGALDAAPLELAQLYNGLANGGFRSQLRAVLAVISADGKPLKAFPLEVTPVADEAAIYQLGRMMEQVMVRGTGRGARGVLPADLAVAGKSGTSSDLRDSWFAGFSGSHLAVVWVGFDDNQPTGLTGSAGALPIWSRVMAGLPGASWNPAPPESLKEVQIEYATGLLANPQCAPDLLPEAFVNIPVPVDAQLPARAGCEDSSLDGMIQRAGEWLRDLIH